MANKDLVKQLAPTHLDIPDHADDLKNEIDQAVNPDPEKLKGNLDDPKLKKEYKFTFSWTDGRGRLWNGDFINKILDVGDRSNVGVMRARLSGNVPLEALDSLTVEANLCLAHLSYSLKVKPKWAEDLRSLLDVSLLQAIYMEVASHEATFFGYANAEAAS